MRPSPRVNRIRPMSAMLPLTKPTRSDKASNLLAAARALAPVLARSRALDRKLVASMMTMCFGLSDTEGGWIWKDAYDASEAALVLQVRRLSQQFSRLEDAPGDVLTLAAAQTATCLTQTKRSDEQVELDQFSTPLELASACILAAQIRTGDKVLEPSAGTGLIAVIAEACGAELTLNELATTRAEILENLFAGRAVTRHDGAHLHDMLAEAGSFDAVVMNPPFKALRTHLLSAARCLADGGRMAAIVPVSLFDDNTILARLETVGTIVAMIAFPRNAYARHGTGVETGLIVVDRTAAGPRPAALFTGDLAELANTVVSLPQRASAKPRLFRTLNQASVLNRGTRQGVSQSARSALFNTVRVVDYQTKPWGGLAHDVGVFQSYDVGRISSDLFPRHPAALVESSAMGTTAPPAPSYRPVLPTATLEKNYISLEQFEIAVYAGEAHSEMLPGYWKVDEKEPHRATIVAQDTPGAVRFRKGFFVGDGTGVGKGTSAATVLADNFAQGRRKAVWFSRNESLLEDARRDWTAIGGSINDIVPQSRWNLGEEISGEFCLFSTYATLRQAARGSKKSRLQQIVDFLGPDFDGLIIFDEAHAMANAAGGGEGARGPKKASLQGQAGLALQNLLPNARVLLVSATGATEPGNLAYAVRLGLWGGPDAPFPTRDAFLEAAEAGGISLVELVARDLKSAGLYLARSISMAGVEIDPLHHELTPSDIEIWDAWAKAFEIIHGNMEEALKATGVLNGEGGTVSGAQLSAARSAFASTSQRFFGALLSGIKAPTIIKAIREHLAANEACVVQLVSTNEAALERRLEEVGPGAWNDLNIDLTPRDAVFGYLERSFPTGANTEVKNEKGEVSLVPLLDAHGNRVQSQEALALREAMMLDLACLPAVPGVLDAIIHAFGADAVAEVTGRSKRVLMKNGRQVLERRSTSSNRAETDAFQSGRKKILVFSDAGGTGRSYHADSKCGNQLPRVHMLAEGGWRPDNAIQGLGRTNRTNQVQPPLFRPVSTQLPGERRFLSTICRRLDSMGALTRGERRSASNGLFRPEDNLETAWARRAQLALFSALRAGNVEGMTIDEFERKSALTLRDESGVMLPTESMPALHTFLNRVLAMTVGDQEALFAAFDAIHTGILEKAKADGTLDLGMEDLRPEELEVVGEEIIRTDPATGAQTKLTTFVAKTRRKILSSSDALDLKDKYRAGSVSLMINQKTGNAGLIVHGRTMIDDHDRLHEAVQIIQPTSNRLSDVERFKESAWEPCPENLWRSTWDQKVLATDPWETETINLVSGLVLPIWKLLPTRRGNIQVRRVCADDGRRWLGLLLHPAEAMQLRHVLGVAGSETFTPEQVVSLVLEQGRDVELAGGYWLRRRKVMDRFRIELDNAVTERSTFLPIGIVYEIIAYKTRPYVPLSRPEVLEKLLATFPVQGVDSFQEAA